MRFDNFLSPNYAPVYVPLALSLAGLLFYMLGEPRQLHFLLQERWSLRYFITAPFIHAGGAHFLFNAMALHYLGGLLLLPLLGKKHFIALLVCAALCGSLINNLFSNAPAIGLSGAIMGILSCGLYAYGKAPMRLLFIHDVLRLPPFQYRYIAAFVVLLDIAGIIFGWGFFAHWGHLGGFAAGLLFGYLRFVLRVL